MAESFVTPRRRYLFKREYIFFFLQPVTVERAQIFRALLGHFTLAQKDRFVTLFETAGEPVPWTSIVNPYRMKLLIKLEAARKAPSPVAPSLIPTAVTVASSYAPTFPHAARGSSTGDCEDTIASHVIA